MFHPHRGLLPSPDRLHRRLGLRKAEALGGAHFRKAQAGKVVTLLGSQGDSSFFGSEVETQWFYGYHPTEVILFLRFFGCFSGYPGFDPTVAATFSFSSARTSNFFSPWLHPNRQNSLSHHWAPHETCDDDQTPKKAA